MSISWTRFHRTYWRPRSYLRMSSHSGLKLDIAALPKNARADFLALAAFFRLLEGAATHRSHTRYRTEESHGKYLRDIAWNASVCLNCFKAREKASTKESETRALVKQT